MILSYSSIHIPVNTQCLLIVSHRSRTNSKVYERSKANLSRKLCFTNVGFCFADASLIISTMYNMSIKPNPTSVAKYGQYVVLVLVGRHTNLFTTDCILTLYTFFGNISLNPNRNNKFLQPLNDVLFPLATGDMNYRLVGLNMHIRSCFIMNNYKIHELQHKFSLKHCIII